MPERCLLDLNISWDYDTHSEESRVGGVWRGISVVGTAADTNLDPVPKGLQDLE